MTKRSMLAGVLFLSAAFALTASAQEDEVYAIRGARIHTLAGPAIENGTIVIRNGRIADVGENLAVPSGVKVIEADGLDVYPGLFDSVTHLGLSEVGAVAATVDTTELGEFNPQLKAITAVHPASELIPVARANGITHAVAAPGGGGRGGPSFGIPGQASLYHLEGWTVEEMAIAPSIGMMLGWPTKQTTTFDPATFSRRERLFKQVKKEYDERVAELSEWMTAARHYAQAREKGDASRFEKDEKLEALARVVSGELPVLIRADDADTIRDAIDFATENGLRMILAGGAEAYQVKELLAEKGIPVILGPTQAVPREEDDPYDRAYSNAGELHAAGVKIAFATFGAANSRTLPFEAGMAVGYGLPKEEGLRAVTVNPAEILGMGQELGTIEEGKVANLIVTDGDPLEIRTEVKHVLIKGEPVDLTNKHLELYEKYRSRPLPTK